MNGKRPGFYLFTNQAIGANAEIIDLYFDFARRE